MFQSLGRNQINLVSSLLVASKRARFAVQPANDEGEIPRPVSVFSRRKKQEQSPSNTANGPSESTGVDLTNDPLTACRFCLQITCITSSAFKPQGRSDARITNHTKRLKDYKWYWRTLKDCGLWDNPIYIERKQELGCHIDDLREVMPHCVVKDVRERWPNPPHVPYQGHRRS